MSIYILSLNSLNSCYYDRLIIFKFSPVCNRAAGVPVASDPPDGQCLPPGGTDSDTSPPGDPCRGAPARP